MLSFTYIQIGQVENPSKIMPDITRKIKGGRKIQTLLNFNGIVKFIQKRVNIGVHIYEDLNCMLSTKRDKKYLTKPERLPNVITYDDPIHNVREMLLLTLKLPTGVKQSTHFLKRNVETYKYSVNEFPLSQGNFTVQSYRLQINPGNRRKREIYMISKNFEETVGIVQK